MTCHCCSHLCSQQQDDVSDWLEKKLWHPLTNRPCNLAHSLWSRLVDGEGEVSSEKVSRPRRDAFDVPLYKSATVEIEEKYAKGEYSTKEFNQLMRAHKMFAEMTTMAEDDKREADSFDKNLAKQHVRRVHDAAAPAPSPSCRRRSRCRCASSGRRVHRCFSPVLPTPVHELTPRRAPVHAPSPFPYPHSSRKASLRPRRHTDRTHRPDLWGKRRSSRRWARLLVNSACTIITTTAWIRLIFTRSAF